MRHLTAQPGGQGLSPGPNTSTPRRLEIRRELASAQRERVKEEYGYELEDDPLVQVADDREEIEDVRPKRQRLSMPSTGQKTTRVEDLLSLSKEKLAHACRLAHQLGVAGNHVNEDTASMFVKGHGYLHKPLSLRFDEVTAQNLVLATTLDELPRLHADLYRAHPGAETFCVMSASSESCEMVSITKDGLLSLCQDALRIHGKVRRVDDGNLGVRASRANHKGVECWLVKNRGVICCSKSIEGALANLVFTTRACSFQVRALAAVGGDLSRLDVPSASDAVRARTELLERCSDEEAAENMFRILSK